MELDIILKNVIIMLLLTLMFVLTLLYNNINMDFMYQYNKHNMIENKKSIEYIQ